jgi:hypothetical protein
MFCTGKPTVSTSAQTCLPLPTSWDMPVLYMTGEAGGSGTWYLAIMWQNQHFLRGLRAFNFVLVPNPESRFQRETCERLHNVKEGQRSTFVDGLVKSQTYVFDAHNYLILQYVNNFLCILCLFAALSLLIQCKIEIHIF